MALRLTRWTPGREVLIRDEAWSLCCVLGYDALSKQCPSLSNQEYKWGTSQLSEKADKMSGGDLRWTRTSHPGESSNTPDVATCYGNWDKLSWTGHVVRAQTFKPPLTPPPLPPGCSQAQALNC